MARQPLLGADYLLDQLRKFCVPWRRLTIAIDGRKGAGKSSTGRHLSWQLGMPVLETDLWLANTIPLTHHIDEVRTLILQLHACNRPIIVEGIMILRMLEQAGIQPDFLVTVTNLTLETSEDDEPELPSSISADVDAYLRAYQPELRADFHLMWAQTGC